MDDYISPHPSMEEILLANSSTLPPEYGQSFGQHQRPDPEPASVSSLPFDY